MTRAMTVLLVAALCASFLGVDEPSWAAQDDAGEAARQKVVASRMAKIKVGAVVKVERVDGRRVEGVLTEKTPASITVNVYQRRAFRSPRLVRTDTIPLDEVKDIKKPLSGTQIALLTTGAVVGTCAIITAVALNSEGPAHSPQAPSSTPEEEVPSTAEPSIDDQGSLDTTP